MDTLFFFFFFQYYVYQFLTQTLLAVIDNSSRVVLFNYKLLNFVLGSLSALFFFSSIRECSHRCLCPFSSHFLVSDCIHEVVFLYRWPLSQVVVSNFHWATFLTFCLNRSLVLKIFLTSTIWLVVQKNLRRR